MTWKEALSDINENLDEGHRGTGPELHAKEVDRLTFCCCECCHGDPCRCFSEGFVGQLQDRFMERTTMQRKCYAIYQSVFLRCVLTLLHFFRYHYLVLVTLFNSRLRSRDGV